MADASQYPVTQPYGYDPSYPLNGGNHRGIDYGCPVGTPVVVNGETIGLSGKTGAVTGPHLHVGKFLGGVATNPGSGGFQFTSAVVTEIGSDSVNGKYVKLQADGATWVYLHLNSQNVSKGQQIKKEELMPNEGDVHNAYLTANGRKATAEELKVYTSKPWSAPDGLLYGKVYVDLKGFKESAQAEYIPNTEQLYKRKG